MAVSQTVAHKPDDEGLKGKVLWKKSINGLDLEIRPVTAFNMASAIDIAAQGFPGELEQVVQSLTTSIRPPEQATLPGAQDLERLEYYVLYVNGQPAGMTGSYTYKNAPKEAWLGWTAVSYAFRGKRPQLGNVLLDYFTDKMTQEGKEAVYGWSAETPSQRFEAMHQMLEKRGWNKPQILKQPHLYGKYLVYSLGLNGHQVRPYVEDVAMAGGVPDVKEPLKEPAALFQLLEAERRYARTNREKADHVAKFKAEFGNSQKYVNDGRFVDLTDAVRDQVRNPLTESFNQLNEKLFPVAEEREKVFGDDGLKLYVQPDRNESFAPNERRILAVLDEKKERVVAAIVYNLASFPENLRRDNQVDATLGVTYLMTDEKYRANGLGRQLIEKAKEKSALFLRDSLGIDKPRIMLMTEQNDPMKMSLKNCIDDFTGVLVGPAERQSIWGKFGQRLVEGFNYTQVSLREGLEGIRLGLHVTLPHQVEKVSSDFLRYAVRSYASLALNKQRLTDIDQDPDMSAMLK